MNTFYIRSQKLSSVLTHARFKNNTLYITLYIEICKFTQYIDLHIPSFVRLLHITVCKTKTVTKETLKNT